MSAGLLAGVEVDRLFLREEGREVLGTQGRLGRDSIVGQGGRQAEQGVDSLVADCLVGRGQRVVLA